MAFTVPGLQRTELLERDLQLEVLNELLAGAREGSGSVAFVSGEPGAGKSSLVQRFVASVGDMRVLTGVCDGVSTPRPLGPIYDMAAKLSPGARTALADPDNGRQQLFDLLLEDLRAGGPSVVVVEDLHWSDHATLDLLRFVGRRISGTRTLLIGTYRDEDVGPFDALRIVIGDLATLDWTHRIEVPPLSPAAVALMARDSAIDSGELHRLTGGNAFFVAEVLASGEGDSVPGTVRDAIRSRVGRLSERGRHALEAAAVLGARVDPWLLAAVAGEKLSGVDESLAKGLLRREGEAIVFRHELTRMTVIEDLPMLRGVGLHRSALRHLSRAGGADPARLAYHAEGAADAAAVLQHAPEAARQAIALRAHGEAIAQCRRALRFGDRLPDERRAELLEAMSYELHLLGHLEEAHRTRVEALALRRPGGDPVRIGDNLRHLSRVAWFTGRGAEGWEAAHEAVRLLEPTGERHETAMALGNLGHLHMIEKHAEEALDWNHRALEMGRRLGDPEVISYALNNLGTTELEAGLEAGRAKLGESLAIARRHNMQEHIDRALYNLGEVALSHHRYDSAEESLVACLEFTASCDLERCQLLAHSSRALARLHTGRWADAEALAAPLLVHPRVSPHGRIMALCVIARLALRRGDSAAARPMIDEAAELAGRAGGLGNLQVVASTRAEAAWLADDAAGTRRAYQHVYPLALEHGNEWELGEAAAWLHRAGALESSPERLAPPYALELAGRHEDAAATWLVLGNAFEAALCRSASDDPAEVRAAHTAALELGATATAERIAARLRHLGAAVPRGPRAATAANPSGLTEREAEIAELMAAGLTNAEIARQLVISEKTVGHHASAVLGKLDVRRRASVASALAEHRSTQR
jgi:DNA-binding CsgD family transcriptional regulator/tetratricopeptide (TPR) repeat protein